MNSMLSSADSSNSKPPQISLDEASEGVVEEEEVNQGALSLFIAFILYIIIGSFIIASYEPEMDVFKVCVKIVIRIRTSILIQKKICKNEKNSKKVYTYRNFRRFISTLLH